MNGGGDIYSPAQSNLGNQNQTFNYLANQNAQALNNYAPSVTQQAQNLTSQYINNPYQIQAQQGAQAASGYGTGTVVPGMQQGASALQGLGNSITPYAQQALQTGFDPQNALYDRQYQRMLDQQNAINSMSGVGQTPYGAGLTGQAAQNFNLDWLDRALGRQATAAGTASTLGGAAGNAFTGAAGLGTGAIQTQAGASALPASTYDDKLQRDLQMLTGQNTAVGGATGANNAFMQNLLAYLGYGTESGKAKADNESSAFGGIGKLLGGLAMAPMTGGGSLFGSIFG